jgi:hypothetical protein
MFDMGNRMKKYDKVSFYFSTSMDRLLKLGNKKLENKNNQ